MVTPLASYICQLPFFPCLQTIAGFDDAFDMVVDRMNENRAHLEGLKTLDAAVRASLLLPRGLWIWGLGLGLALSWMM